MILLRLVFVLHGLSTGSALTGTMLVAAVSAPIVTLNVTVPTQLLTGLFILITLYCLNLIVTQCAASPSPLSKAFKPLSEVHLKKAVQSFLQHNPTGLCTMEGPKKKARVDAAAAAAVDSADVEHSAISLALAKEESALHLGKVAKNLDAMRVS